MGDSSLSKVTALAKRQLGLSSSASDSDVPDTYIIELQNHLFLYPNDDNFRVRLEPGYGLGKVLCLEKGCEGVSIPLIRRVGVKDGGHEEGCGSLSTYQVHIREHPTHEKSRRARVKVDSNTSTKEQASRAIRNAPTPSIPVKQEPIDRTILAVHDSSPSAAQPSKSLPSTPAGIARRAFSITPVNPRIDLAKRRVSDTAFYKDADYERNVSPALSGVGSLKRPKIEPKPDTPLSKVSQVNSIVNTGSKSAAPEDLGSSNDEATKTILRGLSEVDSLISRTQNVINRISQKRAKDPDDIAALSELMQHMRGLKGRREKYKAALLPMTKPAITPSGSGNGHDIDLSKVYSLVRSVNAEDKKSAVSPALKMPVASRSSSRQSAATSSSTAGYVKIEEACVPGSKVQSGSGKGHFIDLTTAYEEKEPAISPALRTPVASGSVVRSSTSIPQSAATRIKMEEALVPNNQTQSSSLKRHFLDLTSAYEEKKPVVSPALKMPVDFGSGVRSSASTPSSVFVRIKAEEVPVASPSYISPFSDSPRTMTKEDVKPKPEPEPLPFIAAKVPYAPPGHFYSEDDDDGDPLGREYDGLAGVDRAFAADIINRVGINMPVPLANANNFDEDGDFFGRGKDLFVGPQARADDIDQFLIAAGNAEAFDGNARVEEALEKLGLQNAFQPLPGMEVALMTHQIIGVAWMLDKEQSLFKGGCLGDDMGLGKTVQMIALMMKNRSGDPLRKTNLIIAPTALLDQWKLELETKTNVDLKCLVYHGQSKPRKRSDLLKYDVVLTTYMTMSLEWPDYEKEMKKKQKARKRKANNDFIVSDSDEEMKNATHKKRGGRKTHGMLFEVDFYRIILDEAQAVRNRRTRASRAVTELRSTYRWCLTGTPIINSLGDAYGYIRFLKVRPWYDFTEFQSHIGILEKKNPGLAVSRLQTVFNSFMIRRKKDTEMDGKRLIELPEKKIELIKLEFTTEERDIYSMVETRSQQKFNRFLKAGTVLKNYHQVLVLLLRLRQVCSHPCLIQEGGAAFIAPDEVLETDDKPAEVATELSRARRLVSLEFVAKMQFKFKEAALVRMRAEKESADASVEDEECPICFDMFTTPVITPCGHTFCRTCIVDHIRNAPPIDPTPGEVQYKADERACPLCASPVSKDTIFNRSAFEPTDEELSGKKPTKSTVKKENDDSEIEIMGVNDLLSSKRKRKASVRPPQNMNSFVIDISSDDEHEARPRRNVRRRTINIPDSSDDEDEEEDDDDMSDFIVQSDEEEEEKDARKILKRLSAPRRRNNIVLDSSDDFDHTIEEEEVIFGKRKRVPISEGTKKMMPRFLPSTKMKFMMERLNELFKKKSDEKVLVISQWTACLSLVSDFLTENGIVHVKYQGDMNRKKRENAVKIFMSKDQAKVMLMSLKCGGVGLNLTRANNVISLDLGWSQAVEAQAFDRVHRLGQHRPVDVKRLVISDTVEDRVLDMQLRKQTLADGSLGEGTGKKIGRLTVRELANLFGLDHRGRRLDERN